MKTLLALVLPLSIHAWGDSRPGRDAVHLRDEVTAISLTKGQMTAGRRTSPVPQLYCIGGSAQGRFEPETVLCKNVGFDGHDVQWQCEAEMPEDYRFGAITVLCEGYRHPDDPYILKGSCGLEYKLELTDVGRANRQNAGYARQNAENTGGYSGTGAFKHQKFHSYYQRDSSWGGTPWLMLFFIGVIFYGIYKACTRPSYEGEPGAAPRRWGGGGGGGWFPGSGGGGWWRRNYTPSSGGGNGFWTGAGLGAAAGYMAGSRQANRQAATAPADVGAAPAARMYPSVNRSASHSHSSGRTHTSTAAGGTRRR